MDFPRKVSMSTAVMLTSKLLFNSTISTLVGLFMTVYEYTNGKVRVHVAKNLYYHAGNY